MALLDREPTSAAILGRHGRNSEHSSSTAIGHGDRPTSSREPPGRSEAPLDGYRRTVRQSVTLLNCTFCGEAVDLRLSVAGAERGWWTEGPVA